MDREEKHGEKRSARNENKMDKRFTVSPLMARLIIVALWLLAFGAATWAWLCVR